MTRYRGHPKEADRPCYEGVILPILTCTCVTCCWLFLPRSLRDTKTKGKTHSFTDPICQHERRKEVHKMRNTPLGPTPCISSSSGVQDVGH